MTERFQPGGVTHALVSGLVELALASALLAWSLAVSESSSETAASLAVACLGAGTVARLRDDGGGSAVVGVLVRHLIGRYRDSQYYRGADAA